MRKLKTTIRKCDNCGYETIINSEIEEVDCWRCKQGNLEIIFIQDE